jgi:hypothetical protein
MNITQEAPPLKVAQVGKVQAGIGGGTQQEGTVRLSTLCSSQRRLDLTAP